MERPPHLRLAVDHPIEAGADRIEPTDPRWVIAVTAHVNLEGKSLPPHRRDSVMDMARRLGFRPFEAQAIVALVEDLAHRHRPLGEARAVLLTIRHPKRTPSMARIIAIVVTATMAATLTLRWLL